MCGEPVQESDLKVMTDIEPFLEMTQEQQQPVSNSPSHSDN